MRSVSSTVNESDEKSLSSLALSESDEDDQRRRSTLRPKSKSKKTRSTMIASREESSPMTIPPNRLRGSPFEINSSTHSLATLQPTEASLTSKPTSMPISHREQVTNLMKKLRGLEEG